MGRRGKGGKIGLVDDRPPGLSTVDRDVGSSLFGAGYFHLQHGILTFAGDGKGRLEHGIPSCIAGSSQHSQHVGPARVRRQKHDL